MDVFGVLADPVRRDLLRELRLRGPMRVVDLASERRISRPAISRHLRLLTEAGLSVAEDRGRERHYRFRPAGLQPVVEVLHELDALAPLMGPTMLDALDLEVRRTVRDHRRTGVRAPRPQAEEEIG